MVPINRNPNVPQAIASGELPTTSPTQSRSPSPLHNRLKAISNDNAFFSDIPLPASRNAPISNPHYVIDIFPETFPQDANTSASPRSWDEQTVHDGGLPLPPSARPSSRSVSFQRKVAATLKTGLAVSIPMAAINAVADSAGSALLGTVYHVPDSIGNTLKVGLTAGSLGIASDVAVTVLVAAAGHKYLDKKFYHDKNKTADEMIATKKANSATLTYLGSASSSAAVTLAATALTSGAVTASVVKTVLLSQAVGGLIVHPIVMGAAASALAYGHAKNGADHVPDSLQAGIESHVSWVTGKLTTPKAREPSTGPAAHGDDAPVAPRGDDMV